jgi:hypothetical protein
MEQPGNDELARPSSSASFSFYRGTSTPPEETTALIDIEQGRDDYGCASDRDPGEFKLFEHHRFFFCITMMKSLSETLSAWASESVSSIIEFLSSYPSQTIAFTNH